MRRHLFPFLLLLALLSGSLSAQIPNGYYNDANGLIGDELKTALHDIIKDHNVVSYAGILNAFAYTDCKPNGKLWDMYSNYEYSLSTDLCEEFEQEGECWNREHAWPQSWFNESNTPRNDLFHVYPTDGFVNQQRGNYPYGEVSNPTYTSGNGSKLGPCATSGYSGKVFEPVDEYKGDLARSYFYMSVRYAGEDDDYLEHRWQYNADGTYVYYNKSGNDWIPNPLNTLNEYFVDGNFLCMRWINNGAEYREWWEIASIEDNVMSWTALRKKADGTTYTASFSMVKMND